MQPAAVRARRFRSRRAGADRLPAAATYQATLYDLLSAYARQTQKRARAHVRMKPREVWSLAQAREALTG